MIDNSSTAGSLTLDPNGPENMMSVGYWREDQAVSIVPVIILDATRFSDMCDSRPSTPAKETARACYSLHGSLCVPPITVLPTVGVLWRQEAGDWSTQQEFTASLTWDVHFKFLFFFFSFQVLENLYIEG